MLRTNSSRSQSTQLKRKRLSGPVDAEDWGAAAVAAGSEGVSGAGAAASPDAGGSASPSAGAVASWEAAGRVRALGWRMTPKGVWMSSNSCSGSAASGLESFALESSSCAGEA